MLTRRTFLVLGFALFLLGLTIWLSSGAPIEASVCEQNTQTQKEECTSQNIAFVTVRHVAKFFDEHNGTFSAIFAAAVAVFTWFLWKATVSLRDSTDRLWDAGERQISVAARAADAANLNAQAVIDAERARIFIDVDGEAIRNSIGEVTYMNSPEMDAGRLSPTLGVRYTIKNHGRTPAILKEMSHQLVVQANLLPNRMYAPVLLLPVNHILGGGNETPFIDCLFDSVLSVGQAKAIFTADQTVWFYGYVAYDDTFGWGHELRYVWYYNGGTNGFRLFSYREHKSQHQH